MDKIFSRVIKFTLVLTIILSIPPSVVLAQTTSLVDSEYEPRLLPDSRFYVFKKGFERAQMAFTFRQSSKIELRRRFADKRFVEAQALVAKGKPELVDDTLTVYQQEMNFLVNELGNRGANPDLLPVTVVEKFRKMAARHEATLHVTSLKIDQPLEDDFTNSIAICQQALDQAADLRGVRPIPNEVVADLSELVTLGVVAEEEFDLLIKAKSRLEARERINELVEKGKLSPLEAFAIDTQEVGQFYQDEAKKLQAALQYRTVKSIAALPYITAPPDDLKKQVSEFMNSYQPGTAIPAEIKKYVVPQILGIKLAAESPLILSHLDSNELRPTDQKIFKAMMKTFFDELGSQPSTVSPDQAIPIDATKARQLYIKMQETFAEQTGFTELAKLQQEVGEAKAKEEFFKKRANEFGFYFDQAAPPPGWSTDEWKGQIEQSRKLFYGVKVQPGYGESPVVFNVGSVDWARPHEEFKPFDTEKIRETELKWLERYHEAQFKYEEKRQELFEKYDQKRHDLELEFQKKHQNQNLEFEKKRWEEERERRQEDFKNIQYFKPPQDRPNPKEEQKYEQEQRRIIEEQGKKFHGEVEQHRQQESEQYQKQYEQYQNPPPSTTTPTYPSTSGSPTTSYPTPTTSPTDSQPTTSSPSSTTTDTTHTTPSSGTTTTAPSTTTTSPAPTTTTSPTPTYTQPTDSSSGTSSGTTSPSSGTTTSPTSPTTSPTSGTTSPSPTPTYTDKEAECRQKLGLVGVYPLTETQYNQLHSCMEGH